MSKKSDINTQNRPNKVKQLYKGKKFYAEATKGYTLKILIDSLFIVMKRTTFTINNKGFYHCQADEAEHILFDVAFPRENFLDFYCKKEMSFSLNMNHLHKMVKNVKKKDTIIMHILSKDPSRLHITIKPAEQHKGSNFVCEKVFVPIKEVDVCNNGFIEEKCQHPITKESVNAYDDPKVIKSADFQKMKKITTIGKTVFIKMQKSNYVSFAIDNGDLYGTDFEYGEIVDYEDDEDDDEFLIKNIYDATFPVKSFTLLMKLPGLCKQMQFYAPSVKDYPLKVGLIANDLGNITIHIKDTNTISREQSQKEQDIATGL